MGVIFLGHLNILLDSGRQSSVTVIGLCGYFVANFIRDGPVPQYAFNWSYQAVRGLAGIETEGRRGISPMQPAGSREDV